MSPAPPPAAPVGPPGWQVGPAELTARFALSRREAEVALLLARGMTDAAVAERLAISLHTARRYSERVLRKLRIHSRAAVALTL